MAVQVSTNQKNGIYQISPYMDKQVSIKGTGEGAQTHRVLLGKEKGPTPYLEGCFPRSVTQVLLLDRTSQVTPTVGRSTDSHKARHPIGQLEMVPFIFSHVRRTDHGPCADP